MKLKEKQKKKKILKERRHVVFFLPLVMLIPLLVNPHEMMDSRNFMLIVLVYF